MPRYVAFLRGVSPLNARMPALKACFEQLGFTDVKTLLSSGNVVFTSPRKAVPALAKFIESGMASQLPRSFPTVLRTVDHLHGLLQADPFSRFSLPPGAKRVVTFLGQPPQAPLALPLALDGAQILAATPSEVFSAYLPGDRGPVFMALIEKTFGKNLTTRTLDTVKKCAAA